MGKLKLEIPHNLPAEEAKERLQRFAESLQGRYEDQAKEVTQSWNDNVLNFGFKTFGMRIDGSIAVEPEKLIVTGELPMTAMLFKGKIETEMRDKLNRLLGVRA